MSWNQIRISNVFQIVYIRTFDLLNWLPPWFDSALTSHTPLTQVVQADGKEVVAGSKPSKSPSSSPRKKAQMALLRKRGDIPSEKKETGTIPQAQVFIQTHVLVHHCYYTLGPQLVWKVIWMFSESYLHRLLGFTAAVMLAKQARRTFRNHIPKYFSQEATHAVYTSTLSTSLYTFVSTGPGTGWPFR